MNWPHRMHMKGYVTICLLDISEDDKKKLMHPTTGRLKDVAELISDSHKRNIAPEEVNAWIRQMVEKL